MGETKMTHSLLNKHHTQISAILDFVAHLYRKQLNKHRSQINTAVLIWVFTNKCPTFVTALDRRNIKTISLEKQNHDQLPLYIPLSVLPVVEIGE